MTLTSVFLCKVFLSIVLPIAAVPVDEDSSTPSNPLGAASDIWSSLTLVERTPTCPGECVHAITSIFCDNVLEEVTCGATYLRCCVSNEFSYGTPVETSAPISDNENGQIKNYSSTTTTTTSIPLTTTTTTTSKPFITITNSPIIIRPYNSLPSFVVSSPQLNTFDRNSPLNNTFLKTSSLTTTSTTTVSPLLTTEIIKSTEKGLLSLFQNCPGKCVELKSARFCGNILSNGKCPNEGDQCCLEDIELNPSIKLQNESTNQKSENFKNKTTSTINWSESTEKNEKVPTVTLELTSESMTTATPLPLCEGTCVLSFFSVLCDLTDNDKYCPNGGTCCINRDSTSTVSPIGPCFGTCIPTILSGVCNRPSELILKTTNCSAGYICCNLIQNDLQPNGDQEIKDIHSESSATSSHQAQSIPINNMNVQPHSLPLPSNKVPSLVYTSESPISYPLGPQRPLVVSQASTPTPMQMHSKPMKIPQDQDADSIKEDFPQGVSSLLQPPGGPPFCPGPCIAPMLRFTCFGGNVIYPKFQCTRSGQICCAPMADIQNFEANVLANNGVWKPPPARINVNLTTPGDNSYKIVPKRPNPYMCGVKGTHRKESPRVVGGSDSFPGEWCWQAALINSQNQYLCGGALIGAQWVLTAAHCISKNGDAIYVRLGDFDLTSQVGSRGAQTQRVSTTYIHHNHNGQTLDNDIALLKLQSPVELNDAVCIVCLPARGSQRKSGKRCTVTGYGYKDEAGPISLRIREAVVPIVDDQECTVKINAVTEKLFILPASSFCAGGEEGNDACQGDGGGPLTCEVDGYYELTGLVSWGFGCGRRDVPGVYVKVSSFIGWINQIISVNNQ